MYQPPPGRPVSSPPWFESTAKAEEPKKKARRRLTPEQIAQLRADYLAGLSYNTILDRLGAAGQGVVTRYTRDLPRRVNQKHDQARPVRLPGEGKSAYGARVFKWKLETDPDFRKQRSAAIRAGMAKRKAKLLRAERRAEREAAKVEVVAVVPALQPPPPPSLWQRIVGWFR